MDNVFEKYQEPKEDRPIEINFPLGEKDILNILKGVEYNQILNVGSFDAKPVKVHIRVFSSDRVKCINRENWRKLINACYSNAALMDVIQSIENNNT